MMKNFLRMPKACELLTITHNTNAIFEYASATFKPGALDELKRTAHMISLYPNRDIHIQVSPDTHGFTANNHVYRKRVHAIMEILLKQGIDAVRIQATTHRPVSALDAKDTISVKVMDTLVEPLPWIGPRRQPGDPSYCQAC
jgi:hypothetical protein